jgi:MFS family permease
MESSSRFAALRYKDFRLLWIGQFVSQAGSQMQIVALNWQVYLLTHSAFALGLIGLMRFLPIVIISLPAGAIVDRFNRKTVNILTQITLGIFSLILAITTLNHTISIFILYLFTALAAGAMSFDGPSRQALLPSLVDKKDLGNAMSLWSIMREAATIIGPAIGGFVSAHFGIGNVYVFNAISFAAVIIALLLMDTDGAITGPVTQVSFASIIDGIKFVTSKTMIWSTMILDFFSTFFASATTLIPIFAKDILQVGPQGLGLLYSAPAVGAVLAGLVLTHFRTLSHQGKILLISITCYAAGTILFGISQVFILSLFALFIVGAGDSISTILRNIIRQTITPDSIRGRMMSVNMIFFMGGPQLGEFEAGALAATIGAPLSVVIGGIGTLAVIGILALKLPILRNYQGHEVIE